MACEWVGGKHTCLDLTRVSPLVGVRGSGFYKRTSISKSCVSKVTKYEKVCSHNQYTFILFAFDIFGFLASQVVDLLNRDASLKNIIDRCDY